MNSASSVAGRSSIDMENLFKMKEEYIFVFGKEYYLTLDLAGVSQQFETSVEVFDVTRGIWRQFDIADQGIGNRTKAHVLPISEDSLAVIGGKDEYGIPIDEIGEFNVKHMKCIPTDWRLPRGLSGFASCLLKKGCVAICGGNDG